MKKIWSVVLVLVVLLSLIPMSAFSMTASAASYVTKIAIVQHEVVLPHHGYIWQDYGRLYDSVITDSLDYTVTFADGSKHTLSYYDLADMGIYVDDILYTGEIHKVNSNEYLFAPGKQSVTIECGSESYFSYVNITSYLEWCSNLRITSDYDNMKIDYEDQKEHTYFWRIKPDDTNMYSFYSSDWDNIKSDFTVFDANNRVIECHSDGWNLKKGNEYCLRTTYSYNDYCYSDVDFRLEPARNHTHRYSAATCTKARTCKDCGHATGQKLGHTYSNACDSTCNVCGAKRTVAAHTYSRVTTTKATLTQNGTIRYKCTECGYLSSKTVAVKRPTSFKLSTTTYTYDGKVKSPSVTVKDSAGKTLKKNTDYTVTYASGRKIVGTYKVTVKMKGNYSGTKTLTFKINPPKTSVAKLTPTKTTMKVYVSRKSSAAATGYQIQYATNKNFTGAKTKWITGYNTGSATLTGLKTKTTYFVRVRTYKKVGSTTYYSGWSSIAYMKTK